MKPMIDLDRFLRIRARYGHFASWAVWAPEGDRPKDGVGDLSVLDPERDPALLQTLHADAILLGLNISRPIARPFGNFHDPGARATDFKIRHALAGTRLWGAYMTDVIKDFEEKASGKVTAHLRRDPEFERENVRLLLEEIDALGARDPLLVAFGRAVERIARRNLGDSFEIVRIPHYAIRVSREEYRARVRAILGGRNSIVTGTGNPGTPAP